MSVKHSGQPRALCIIHLLSTEAQKALSSQSSHQCLKHFYFAKCCLTQFKDYWGISTGL